MPYFHPEPAFEHDRMSRIGVLLVNLGTPDAPTPAAVRRYLAEFLSDPRVVEIPAAAWQPILHGYILRTRPKRSAERYASIWTKDGSPLAVHSNRLKVLLFGYLGQKLKKLGLPPDSCLVDLGMRYGRPSLADALGRLRAGNCEKILVLPLYPQYASSTTGSAFDGIGVTLERSRRVPALRFVDGYHDDPGYIKSLAQSIHDYWVRHGRGERLIMSFHGVPRRSLELGDPYHCHCQATSRLLGQELGMDKRHWMTTFQSRFGRAKWLTPYTRETIVALGRDRTRRVDVVCPGFATDCLETLEEIGIEARQAFLDAGGGELHLIPCLNQHPRWVAALADLVLKELQGWIKPPPDVAARELTQMRAKTLGARQ